MKKRYLLIVFSKMYAPTYNILTEAFSAYNDKKEDCSCKEYQKEHNSQCSSKQDC